ncbi:MAG: hypothetical protein ABFR53_00410 [Actinomycetota bacterium]
MGTTQKHAGRSAPGHSQSRSVALTIALWTFGLATSLFLLGMWGRTVAVDSATIEGSARTIINSDLAADRIDTWFEEGLAAAADVDSETARSVVHSIESRPEYQVAVDSIIDAFVESLFATDGDATRVDLERALSPLVPVVADELVGRDVPVEVERIEDALDDAGVIELDTGEAASVAAAVSDARVFLTEVVVMSLLGMLLTGLVAVSLAPERSAMVRQLSSRVMIAALTYAVILRLAGWALDPSRGRSPIAGGTAVIFSSNSQVFLILGSLAAGFAAVAYWLTSRNRERMVEDPDETVDDDTRELASV